MIQAATLFSSGSPSHETLASIPTELKLLIASEIQDLRDLLNFALTCRTLEEVARPFLYRTLILGAFRKPAAKGQYELFHTPRFEVTEWLRSIIVQSTQRPPGRVSAAPSTVPDLCSMLSLMPRNRLKLFRHMIPSPVSHELLEVLFDYQQKSLCSLEIFNMEAWQRDIHSLPSNLSRFHCHSFTNGRMIGQLVFHNHTSIRHLHLGNEASFLKGSTRARYNFVDQPRSILESFGAIVSLQALPCLESLELVAVNLHPILEQSFSHGQTWFHNLNRLVLESCWGSSDFLSNMAYSFRSRGERHPIYLKEFIFRHEAMSFELKEALAFFLASFRGLKSLIVLMENTTYADSVNRLINDHGPTLRKLALECRMSPRLTLAHDTTRAFGHGAYGQMLWELMIKEIVRLCPYLEELGTGLPWDESMVSSWEALQPLHRTLKTLHVRNFPCATEISEIGSYSTRIAVAKFLEPTLSSSTPSCSAFPSSSSRSSLLPSSESHSSQAGTSETAMSLLLPPSLDRPPALELIALGPSLYPATIFPGHPRQSQNSASYFLRTHYFILDWKRNRFGIWNAIVTEVGEKYVRGLRQRNRDRGMLRNGRSGDGQIHTGGSSEEIGRSGRGLGGIFEGMWIK